MHLFAAVHCHGIIQGPAPGCLDGVVPKGGKRSEIGARGESGSEVGHHWHCLEIEAARRACGYIVAIHWEVAIAVGIGARGGDVCGVEDICVDKDEL